MIINPTLCSFLVKPKGRRSDADAATSGANHWVLRGYRAILGVAIRPWVRFGIAVAGALVLVILAVFLGTFSLARAKANKSKRYDRLSSEQKWAKPSRAEPVAKNFKAIPRKREKDGPSHPAQAVPERTLRDLQSGMELLGLDFLLSIVENTNGDDDEKDVTMRKLNFKELLRRGKLNQADSNALKVYAINKGNLYDKDIQCEAIKTLAERTVKGNKRKS
jgi:hypothetical protein